VLPRDLERAEAALAAGATTNDGLKRALSGLVRNLARYRPFLPEGCLVEVEEADCEPFTPLQTLAGEVLLMGGTVRYEQRPN